MAMGPGGATRVSLSSFAAEVPVALDVVVVAPDVVVASKEVVVLETVVPVPDDPQPAAHTSPVTSASTNAT
jgi:hypothetical protein